MGKKLNRSINYDKDGNLSLGGEYGDDYRNFSSDRALAQSKALHQQEFQRKTNEAANRILKERHEANLKKLKEEDIARRLAEKKKIEKATAQRNAALTTERADANVRTAKMNKTIEADKKKKQLEQESTWYKGLLATAADLSSKVPGISDVLVAKNTFERAVLQHAGFGKIGKLDLTDVDTDPLTKIKTIPDGKGGRRKITEEEYQDIAYKDQEQYGKDQEDSIYNIGATAGNTINTAVGVGSALVPTILRAGEGIFGGVSDLVRDSINGSSTAGTDFATKMKLTATNFEAGLTGADVALAEGLDKIVGSDSTGKYLAEQSKRFEDVSTKGKELQRNYLNNRTPYIERDISEEKEGDPLLRQRELDSYEAGLIDEPEWHKKKEGVFENTLGYFAKNPGRIMKYLADGADDIIREGVTDTGAANSEMISNYQSYNDIKAKALFGKDMANKDVEDFKANSQQTTFLTETGETVSIPRNRVDPKILEEDSQASPDYMNIQEVETDDQGRAIVDQVTGQVKYKSKYDGMFGLEKVGKSLDLGSLMDAQYITQTIGSTVGSVLGFMGAGGAVAKGLEKVSAFSKSTRALNTMRSTYGADAVEATGLYGKAASKLAKGAKYEDISKNVILNYINNDSEIRTNAEATRGEIQDELIDRVADMQSADRVAKREAILAEKGITKENPLFNSHIQNMIKEERARYLQLNPEMALNIQTKAEIGAELAAQAGRMQMLTSINETAALFTRSKMLSRAGKSVNPIMRSIRTKSLEAGFEGGEETIGDYSDKYAKSAILDNTFYSVADYAKNDFVTKDGLETFALGALMGVGQNSLAGAKKMVTGDSDNLAERVREYKEQKQALKNIQGLKSANSFEDVLKIYDQLEQQKEVVERNTQIQEALDRGDTNTAHRIKQEAFASHSLRMAKLGLTEEVERNLQHLLKTPGVEGDPAVIQEMTRAIEVNKNIGNIYDIHTPLQNADTLATNRVNKILLQEQIAKLKGDIESNNPMYEEALGAHYASQGIVSTDTSEEGIKLQEKARKEFDADEGSIGGVVNSTNKQIEKFEDKIKNLDKNYYKYISADYQRELRAEKQKSIVKQLRKASTVQEAENILESFPKGEQLSPELAKVIKRKEVKFNKEEKAKNPGFFRNVFSKKVPKKGDEVLAPEVIPSEDSLKNIEATSETTPETASIISEEDTLAPDPVEIKRQEKEILEEQKIPEEFGEDSDFTNLPEGDLTDKEAIDTFNNTLEGEEEKALEDPNIDISAQKDPVIDQEQLTPDQRLAQEKSRIIQEASKKSKNNGISPGLAEDLGNLTKGVIEVTEKRNKATKKTSNILNPDDFFNIQDQIVKKQEQALKLFDVFRSQFKTKNKKEPTYKDLMQFLITNNGYDSAKSVNGFFGQTWIDSTEDKEKARKEVKDAYDSLFGLDQTIGQLSNLANEIFELLKNEGEDVAESTESPRTTIPAQINSVSIQEEVHQEGEMVVESQEDPEQILEDVQITGTKTVLNPNPATQEVIGLTENGTSIISLDEGSSSMSPQFRFSSQEYEIIGENPDGTEIIQDKYPNSPKLNRGDNEDRGGHMNLDNILNPGLATKGAKLKIVPYIPDENTLPDYDKVPFIEYDSNGKRDLKIQSFQDFLDKHDLDPIKYLTPALGPESVEEESKRRLFVENVPMHVTVEHNGEYHQMGTILPSVNYINIRNTFPKGDSPQEKQQQQKNINIKRNNIYKQRQLILSGHSEFKVTERVTKKFKSYELAEGNKTTTEGDKMTLSKAHPTKAIVGAIDKVIDNGDNTKSIVISTGKKLGRLVSLDETHKDIVIDKESVDNFLKSTSGKNTKGWSVVLIYKNTTVDAEGNVKKVYGISQTVNNSNQEVQRQADNSRAEFGKLRAYYRIKELIKKEQVLPENLEAFLKEKVQQGQISENNIWDYKKIAGSPTISANADKIISRLSSKFKVSFMGLSLNPKGILVNSSTDAILQGFPRKYGENDLTVSLSLSKIGGVLPMIDLEKGTVEDYKSSTTGRTGYDAFFEDSVGNSNMGYQIHDVTTGEDITVFSPQPIINFAPVNIQPTSAAPAVPTTSTSSILEKKLAEKRRIQAEKAKVIINPGESPVVQEIPINTPGLTLEEEIENILTSEVKYLDENGEEC